MCVCVSECVSGTERRRETKKGKETEARRNEEGEERG